MTCDPIGTWAERYKVEEAIHAQSEVLDNLRSMPSTQAAIASHIQDIGRVLATLPAELAARYQPWVTAQASYNFGSEAYYQRRILSLLGGLSAAGTALPAGMDVLCARQLINPSAFNGSPRIARTGCVSYVIFPAPTVYWMYSICTMIADCAAGRAINRAKLNLYLRSLIAARSYERSVDPVAAHSIDFLVEEIVHRGDVEDVDPGEIQAPSDTMNMVSAAEEFIICHELAHLLLDHGATGGVVEEAEADRLALDLLASLPPVHFRHFESASIEPRDFPQLGYLVLRMWTIVRLSAEQRILPFICDSPEEVDVRKGKLDKIWAARVDQIDRVGILNRFEVTDAFRAVTIGTVRLAAEIAGEELDLAEIDRIRRMARTLAERRLT